MEEIIISKTSEWIPDTNCKKKNRQIQVMLSQLQRLCMIKTSNLNTAGKIVVVVKEYKGSYFYLD